jgi:hypothetical protein
LFLSLAVACAAALATPPANGQPVVASNTVTPADQATAARRLFNEGLAHADARRWRQAADCFTRAHSIRPSPEIAYNLSTALLRLDRLVSSSELLRQVAADPSASPAVRSAAERRLAQLLPRLAHLTLEVRAGDAAQLWLDGRPLDRAALGAPLSVDPGAHVVELREETRTIASRAVSLSEGARHTVVMEPFAWPASATPMALKAGPADGEKPLWRKGWFLGLVGAAAVGTAVAFALGARAGPSDVRGNVDTWVLPR